MEEIYISPYRLQTNLLNYMKDKGGQDYVNMESIADIAKRVFPDEVQEIREHTAQHIDADRTIGPTDWDRECQESGRLNRR